MMNSKNHYGLVFRAVILKLLTWFPSIGRKALSLMP
jgi:hypothetical protein